METEQKIKKGIAFAILAAALYAINAPFSKILLEFMPPTLMAGFLYVGAGIGMIFIALMRKIKKYEAKELKLTKSELPYTIAMIVLDIAAPICLLFGLNSTTAANASLLNSNSDNCPYGIQRKNQHKIVVWDIFCNVILWNTVF